ncbi:phage tail assembly chaperone [Convivina praedatoris]|uniref:phage tail assembly chaperone n=1 Tax=Convivina praedatoris TaxID=2880963 RepID=UPI0020105C5D|nr:phage tail assembly chaperone [Convivina sp. LMG 32447]CAH1855138.1 hypothetical protein R078138_01067 [Convivina sp. LMG 32447]
MSVKIDVKKMLGTTKRVVVKTSNKNFKKSIIFIKSINRIQLKQMQNEEDSQAIDDSNSTAALTLNEQNMDNMIEMSDTALDYIQSTLKLTDNQIENIDDEHSFNDVLDFATEIATKVTGSESEKGGEKDTLKA